MNPLLAKGFKTSIFGLFKTFGIRTSDIMEAVQGLNVDSIVEDDIKRIETETGEEKIVYMAFIEEGKVYFRTFALKSFVIPETPENYEQKVLILGKSYPMEFMGESREKLGMSDILNEVVKKVFDSHEKPKKEDKQKNLTNELKRIR